MAAAGTFVVSEQRDDQCRRQVLTAVFTRTDGDPEAIPPLREAKLLGWNGTTLAITGVEEIESGPLGTQQRVQQTWLAEPQAYGELERVESMMNRAVRRLREVGVEVEILPGGRMRIAGERSPDGVLVDGS
jgi:hypothetical protein